MVINTQIFLEDMCQLINNGYKVTIPVSGGSMSPFLVGGRDYILLRKPCEKDLKRGKIVLFKRDSGQFVLHRIYSVRHGRFYIIGDGQRNLEGPVEKIQIVAVEDKIMRNGRWLDCYSITNLFFRYIWIRIVFARNFMIKIKQIIKK